MTLTPGAYLKHRRTAAGLSVADVAAQLRTDPRTAIEGRAEWLALIEADVMPMTWSTIVVLRMAFPFDIGVMEELSLLQLGYDFPPPRLCRICACSEECPCDPQCAQTSTDLCSRCFFPATQHPVAA